MKSNYIAVRGASLVCVSSLLGALLEFYGTETNALQAPDRRMWMAGHRRQGMEVHQMTVKRPSNESAA